MEVSSSFSLDGSFAGADFDVCAWVNGALSKWGGKEGGAQSSDDGEWTEERTEERAAGVVLQLQMRQLELAGLLEDSAFEAAGAIPRLLRELERIRGESELLRGPRFQFVWFLFSFFGFCFGCFFFFFFPNLVFLQGRLQQIEHSLGGIEASTERSVALLIELDRVKQNMLQCEKALREAQRFTALSKGIEAGLGEGQDLSAMVAQIREVRGALHILQNVPEFKNATARLAQLERKLELQLRPKFLAALRANDVPAMLELRAVYADIQQESVMKTAYFEARQEPLQTFFNAQAQVPVKEWLQQFYDRLLSIVTAEAEFCQLLFGRERKASVQSELAVYLLDHFARSLGTRMEGLSLKVAVELRNVAEIAAQQLDARAVPFIEAPFAAFMSNYGQAEKDLLLGEFASKPDTDVFVLAETAADRCQALTKFSQLPGLVMALEALFAAAAAKQQQQQHQQPQLHSQGKAGSSSSVVVSAKPQDQWTVVHAALKSLANAKSLYRRLSGFDSRLRARILAVVANDALSADPSRFVLSGAELLYRGRIEAQRTVVFGMRVFFVLFC